jgi:hypothetical protein
MDHYCRLATSPEELLTGNYVGGVIKRQGMYIAWTRTWEGPARPEYMSARADFIDEIERRVSLLAPLAAYPHTR